MKGVLIWMLVVWSVMMVSGCSTKECCRVAPQSENTKRFVRFGYPLGKYLRIEGMRAERGKVGVRTLLVDMVNGKKLDPPECIWVETVDSLPEGERCVLNGYVSGEMIGMPLEVVVKEQLSLHQACWQFHTYFIATSVVEPKGLELNRHFAKDPAMTRPPWTVWATSPGS